MTPTLAAVEYGGPWELPPVNELFEFPAFLFQDTIFAFNRVALLTLSASLIAAALFLLAFRKPSVVPGKLQAACEAVVEFIREQIAVQVIGHDGLRWVPLLTTIFVFVWLNNLFEVIPLINFPPTSRMAIPAFLAVMVYVLFIAVGIKSQGPIGYFKNTLFPPGAPKFLYVLLTPIELVSNFVARPLTLAVRLFANLLAGHIILTLIFITIHAFLTVPGLTEVSKGLPIGIVALLAAPLLIGFELVVGLLQAYIFTILTAVYIGSSLHAEH
ncbi:MAG: F0F1 ATP synthase subunit A [Actinomycetota bacterium]|nr:F0F1 ATP synthase subunit A [Actinomycetota bacterium]